MIIDSHHHWTTKEHFDSFDKLVRKGETVTRDRWGAVHIWRKGVHLMALGPLLMDIDRQIQDMDDAGVDMAVLSLASEHEWLTAKTAPRINELLAKTVDRHPKRFVGACQVPYEGKAALRELERAIREFGLGAVNIGTHVGYRGLPVDDQRYWSFWEKVAEMNLPVIVQPYSYPAESTPLLGYDIVFTLARRDNVFRFMIRMVYGPLLDRFPGLRILCPHLGAGLWAELRRFSENIGRVDYFSGKIALEQMDERTRQQKERIARHMSQLYFDTAPPRWGQPELSGALTCYGEDHILFGTDYPIGPAYLKQGVAMIESMNVSSTVKSKIFGENASRFFGIPCPQGPG